MNSPTSSPPTSAWKELNVDANNMDPLSASLPRISVSPSSHNKNAKMTAETGKISKQETQMISINGKLLDPNNYFGDHARKEFFNNYQEMSKNRNMYSGHERALEISLESRGASRLSLSRNGSVLPSLDVSKSDLKFSTEDFNKNIWGENDAFLLFDEDKLRKSNKNFYGHHANCSRKLTSSNLSKSLSTLLLSKSIESFADSAAIEDFSPRTKYIGACIRDHITPLPKLVLRKDEKTTSMNLSHFGIHDQMGKILAECLDDLPSVESIDISGNSLTDVSLPLLFESFHKIPNLKYLNLSRSKIDKETSAALAKFLSNPECPLSSLILQHADVDDYECARFILCLKSNLKLRELDLGSNLLGSAEIFQGAKSEAFNAGGKAIAEFIASTDCRLSSLKLGWNSIKMASSVDIAKALSLNHTLMYLDLSYNGLSQLAGEYIGDSLQSNKTLHTLILDSNKLNGIATFCICVGLQNNTTLRKISLDKNPIGEFGAKAIIQVPEFVGQRCNLSAVGCNIRLRETNSIFSFEDLVQDYSLNLEKPFERTVARWLLEKVASHNSILVNKITYDAAGNGKQTPINLVLVSMSEEESYKLLDEHHKHLIDGYRRLLAATEDVNHAERVFLDADLDSNDKLDKEELTLCLEDLGYPLEPETVDDIFFEFDVDFSGTMEREEFFHFLKSKVEETKARLTEILEKYYYALAESLKDVYTPPKTGILNISVVNNFTDKGPKNVVTALQQKYASEQAVKLGDSNLISCFAQHTRLRYNEALKIYKAINAEVGNMAIALSKVLVRMLRTCDAHALLGKITKSEALKMNRVKKELSHAYHPLLGNVNGFYCLNLSQEMDRLCLTQLLEHSKVANSKRQKDFSFGCLDGKLGDTSQHGNWTCFRNEMLNNEPFQITSAAFMPMKTSGILEFDYSSIDRPPMEALPINDFRLCRILHHITLLPKDDLYKALSILGELKEITSHAELHFAHVIYEGTMSKARTIGLQQDEFYNCLSTRGEELKVALKKEIVTTDIKNELPRKYSSRRSMLSRRESRVNSFKSSRSLRSIDERDSAADSDSNLVTTEKDNQAFNTGNVSGSEEEKSEKSVGGSMLPGKRMSKLKSIRRLPGEDYDYSKALEKKDPDSMPSHIVEIRNKFTDLLINPTVTSNAKAFRIFEVLIDLFSKVYLRCRHILLMIRHFQFGVTVRVPKYGSYLVELVVFLFPRIVDLHNFEIIMNELSAEDCAALYCRIGWLHIFNPCKVDGGYELQLNRREEKMVIKMIVTLSIDEPCQNIMDQEFQWDRIEPPMPGWDLTEGWKTVEGIPARGILRVYFTSYGSKKEPNIPNAIIEHPTTATAVGTGDIVPHHEKKDSVKVNANKFVESASYANSKRQYRVNNELRRCLTFSTLIDHEACLKCETETETKLAIAAVKKGVDIKESVKARKSLWNYLYAS